MTIEIEVDGTDYPVPSSAADTNWAAMQVAFCQAIAAYANSTGQDLADAEANILALQGNRVQVLSKNVTPVGTGADTTEDNLMTYTLPASTLSAIGKGIRVTAVGIGANTADATTVRAYFGAGLATEVVLPASQGNLWRLVFEVWRTGAATQVTSAMFGVGPFSGGTQATTTQIGGATETLSGAIVVKLTGQRASSSIANSIQQVVMAVELLP